MSISNLRFLAEPVSGVLYSCNPKIGLNVEAEA